VICPQVAEVQARESGHEVGAEISLLCTHGILHLLGFDHAEPEEHATMFALQDKLLGSWPGATSPDGAASPDDAASLDGAASVDGAARPDGPVGQDEAGQEPPDGPPR
jgi:probable rRNA maturation factor